MATYLKDVNAVYLAAPGTASTSIERMFLDQMGGVYIDAPDAHFRYGTRHATLDELIVYFKSAEGGVQKEKWGIDLQNLQCITSVRNPFSYHYAEWYRNRTKWVDLLLEPDSWVYKQPNKIRQIVTAVKHDFSDWLLNNLGENARRRRQVHVNAEFVATAQYFVRSEHIEADIGDVLSALGIKRKVKELFLNQTDGVPDGARRSQPTEYWRH